MDWTEWTKMDGMDLMDQGEVKSFLKMSFYPLKDTFKKYFTSP